MKKLHFVLLVVTAVMALFSAYSLAAVNQVYKVYYEWYSQYSNRYLEEYRNTAADRWLLGDYPPNMVLKVIADEEDLKQFQEWQKAEKAAITASDLGKYVFLYCSFGQVELPEYRIKVIDIAQRGNTVEVKVSMNSPAKQENEDAVSGREYYPADIIRIRRDVFPSKGKLYFIFKNQDGNFLGEQYCDVY